MLKLVVILGTNASGKGNLGIRLSRHFGGGNRARNAIVFRSRLCSPYARDNH